MLFKTKIMAIFLKEREQHQGQCPAITVDVLERNQEQLYLGWQVLVEPPGSETAALGIRLSSVCQH